MKNLIIVLLFLMATTLNAAPEGKLYRASVDSDGVQRVTLTGGSYFFDPAHIIVRVNVPVEMRVRKEPGIVPHDLVITEIDGGKDIRVDLDSEARIVRFTPLKSGKYPIYCSKKLLFFESHREKGMEGILEVVE